VAGIDVELDLDRVLQLVAVGLPFVVGVLGGFLVIGAELAQALLETGDAEVRLLGKLEALVVLGAVPLGVAHEHDLGVRAGLVEHERPVADHHPVVPLGLVVELLDRLGHREEQLETGYGVEVGVGRGKRDRQGHCVVVGLDAFERVGLAVELLGTALDERHQVRVDAREVGVTGPLPGTGEGAGQHLLAVRELQALADLERPDRGVVVGFVGLGDLRPDDRVVRVAGVDVGQAVIERIDHLVGIERLVEAGVDVLGRVTDERAQFDEIAALLEGRRGLVAGPLVSVVATTAGGGDEGKTEEKSK